MQGTPYPTTELTAALGVMDYAVNVLGFKESEIMVYGWSIGGFPATYVARTFPNIRGLVSGSSVIPDFCTRVHKHTLPISCYSIC